MELSARERLILILIAAGKEDGEIADQLYISKSTVQSHIANMKSKNNASSRAQLVARAAKEGLLS